MRWIDSCNHKIFIICLLEHNIFLKLKDNELLNFTKEKKKGKGVLRGITLNSNLFETIDQFPLLFESIEYTTNSELHVTFWKRHVRSRASRLA